MAELTNEQKWLCKFVRYVSKCKVDDITDEGLVQEIKRWEILNRGNIVLRFNPSLESTIPKTYLNAAIEAMGYQLKEPTDPLITTIKTLCTLLQDRP